MILQCPFNSCLKYITFLIHIFRLVSAYQDKVIDRPVGSIMKSLKNNYGKTNFESFAYLVIKSASKNECLKTYGNCKFNNHWKPYIRNLSYKSHYAIFVIFFLYCHISHADGLCNEQCSSFTNFIKTG